MTSQAIFNTAMSRLQGENKLAENTETYLARELNHDLFIHPSTFYLLSSGNPELATLCSELRGVDWVQLGLQLQVPPWRIQTIRQQHPRNEARCLMEMLDWWMKQDTDVTWEGIAVALRSIEEAPRAEAIIRRHLPHQERGMSVNAFHNNSRFLCNYVFFVCVFVCFCFVLLLLLICFRFSLFFFFVFFFALFCFSFLFLFLFFWLKSKCNYQQNHAARRKGRRRKIPIAIDVLNTFKK